MKLSPLVIRLIIIGFFILIGYCLAGSVMSANLMGIILATVSLCAAIIFMYLLPKLYEAPPEESNP